VQSDIKAARDSLSGGDLRVALNSLSRAKSKGVELEVAKSRELKQVETELRKAQSSNLISAQNNYFFANAGQLGDQIEVAGGRQQQIAGAFATASVDGDIASLQWDKLEKAQQVNVAKVTPLRVNLPTRGVHYSFSQVLQTETDKPMTLRLLAENTKDPSWIRRIGLTLLGFGVLWLTIGLINSRKAA
jgi:hypothetical protein